MHMRCSTWGMLSSESQASGAIARTHVVADAATSKQGKFGLMSCIQPTDEARRAGDETRLGSPASALCKPCWLHESDYPSSSSS